MQWLIDRFTAGADRVAFVHRGRPVDYGSLVAGVESAGQRLDAAGVQPGDRVVLAADYSPEAYAVLLALALRGCTSIPLTPGSVVEESAALAVCGSDWHVAVDGAGAALDVRRRTSDVANPLLEEFRAAGAPGLVLFSSGSSGRPKAMLHDLHTVAEKFRRPRRPTVAVPFLMLDHFGGINTLLGISSGLGTAVTVASRSVGEVCAAIEQHRVELLPTTPSFLALLLVADAHRQHDLSSLTRITYGTEVMPQRTLDQVRAAFPGVELQQTYGLSEVGVLRSRSRPDGSLWMRLGGDGFQTQVRDRRLWIRSDYAMVGYLNAPSGFDADGWFDTQDEVEVDGDWFRVLGRVTDLINVGGQKVYPGEVEEVVLGLEGVLDVAVHGQEHALLGQVVAASVVLARPEPVADLKRRIRRACAESLAAYKVPVKVSVVEGPLHTSRHKKVRRAG